MDAFTAILWLTLNLYHEARGEEQLAQIAVAHATLNRAKERGLTVKKTVLQPRQFSWTIGGQKKPIHDPAALLKCYEVAQVALKGRDFTRGATHYHEKKVKPIWRKKMVYLGEYGNHKFYKRKS